MSTQNEWGLTERGFRRPTYTELLDALEYKARELFGRLVPARELDLPAAPEAQVYLPRCMSAFVGADITTALLASGICEDTKTALLTDIGTNGEMALWHQGELSCCSTAAGPAFEGANLSQGMQGAPGAIDRAWVGADGKLAVHTIGGAAAVGICGSGVADVTACFGPAGGESGGAVLRLYGPAPQLDGLRLLPEEGTLPPGLAPLPLLALLWECGRLRPEQIRIFPA